MGFYFAVTTSDIKTHDLQPLGKPTIPANFLLTSNALPIICNSVHSVRLRCQKALTGSLTDSLRLKMLDGDKCA